MRLLKQNIWGYKVHEFLLMVLGEILLVFIGIYLALQAENWSESKKDRELEAFSINSLYSEMQLNEKDLKITIAYHERAKNALAVLLTINLDNYTDTPSRTIDSLLAEAQWAWTFNPRMGVIKSIISSGQIKNIRNQDLRLFITSFEDIINDSNEESNMNNKLIVEQFIPMVNRFVGEGTRGRYLGFNMSKSRFPSDYKGLFSSREYESLISYMYLWRVDQQTEEAVVHEQITKGLEVLKKEIESAR